MKPIEKIPLLLFYIFLIFGIVLVTIKTIKGTTYNGNSSVENYICHMKEIRDNHYRVICQ